jgi:hypothetical protein
VSERIDCRHDGRGDDSPQIVQGDVRVFDDVVEPRGGPSEVLANRDPGDDPCRVGDVRLACLVDLAGVGHACDELRGGFEMILGREHRVSFVRT